MSPADCASIVQRITASWPAGPKGWIWTNALTPLDAQGAQCAYERLLASAIRPPSVAEFMTEYRRVTQPPSTLRPPAETGPPVALAEILDRLPADARAAIEHRRNRPTQLAGGVR